MSEEIGLTSFPQVFARIERREVDAKLIEAAFRAILDGAWTSVQVAAFAVALRLTGESAEVIAAAARALRGTMAAVEHGLPLVADTCGTGGDGACTLNISTAAAVLVAACGVPVAKHGNRSVSSRCGSADVIEALGVAVDVAPGRQHEVLAEAGIAFLYAPAHHAALRHAAQARRELGLRTIFNAIGPLANPARATHQLVGVYEDRLRPLVAGALRELGVRAAWVVRGEDGLDELSPCGPTRVTVLAGGELHEEQVTPEDFGLRRIDRAEIAGDNAEQNAAALRRIFAGEGGPAADAVILNAAAVLHVTGEPDRRGAAARAREALTSGAAAATLERWSRAASSRRA